MNVFAAWITAVIATFGSLFFSEVMGFIPCSLCWYQRIAMYPLVAMLGVPLWKNRSDFKLYVYPLSIAGNLLALYHLGVQYEIIPESASPCVVGVPCSSMYIQWLGFITIPFLSFIAFTLINLLLWKTKNEKH